MVHDPLVAVQPPVNPAAVLPESGLAVSVTDAPELNDAEHPAPAVPFVILQLMPAGFEVTVPVPFPVPVIVSVNVMTVTVTGTCLVTPSDVALMVVVPARTANTLPVPSTVATFVALDEN